MKNIYILIAIIAVCFWKCDSTEQPSESIIVYTRDYKKSMDADYGIKNSETNIKIAEEEHTNSPSNASLINLATAYGQKFELTGDMDLLKKAEHYYLKANELAEGQNSELLKNLATNYMRQYRFHDALTTLNEALKLNDDKSTNNLLFDIHIELGNYGFAYKNLQKLTDKSDANYFLRQAQWHDLTGNFDKAMECIQRAEKLAEVEYEKKLLSKIYPLLADYQIRKGEVKTSYEYHLKKLKIVPNDWSSLKEIAWIAYTHDRNVDLAEGLIGQLMKYHQSPELNLFMVELAEYKGDEEGIQKHIDAYLADISSQKYGGYYSKFNCILYAEKTGELKKALELAREEISLRKTPDTYDLLAWTLYLNGDLKEAKKIADEYVLKKSNDPQVLYHLAHIYKATNEKNILTGILKDLKGADYKLGPITAAEVATL